MKTVIAKFWVISLIILMPFVSVIFFPKIQKALVPVSWADDDERDDEEEDEDEDSDEEETTAEESEPKIEYETISQKLPDTVTNTTVEIPVYDSDGDGMYDDEDPHPDINEFLIVKDDNLNGIDDRYEQ